MQSDNFHLPSLIIMIDVEKAASIFPTAESILILLKRALHGKIREITVNSTPGLKAKITSESFACHLAVHGTNACIFYFMLSFQRPLKQC